MTQVVLPLAHAGEGATWQALLALLSFGLVAVVVLAAFRVVTIEEPGDLILPLAGAAVLASLSGATAELFSDTVGWAFPIGVVALVALLVAALTSLELSLTSPLLIGAVVVGAIGAVTLHGPITLAWHPNEDLQVAAVDDLEVSIASPEDGATVSAGTIEVVVQVSGGTLGDGPVEPSAAPEDPEERVIVNLSTLGSSTDTFVGVPAEDCSTGCEQATFEVTLDEPGEWDVYVEALTAASQVFEVTPTDRVTVTVE